MAIRYSDGFDTYSTITELRNSNYYNPSDTTEWDILVGGGKFGGGALRFTGTYASGDEMLIPYKEALNGTTIISCWVKLGEAHGTARATLTTTTETAAAANGIGISSLGKVTIYREASVHATTTTDWPINTWVWVEVKVVTADTAGEITVKFDGVEIYTATGISTGTSTAEVSFIRINPTADGATATFLIDDLVILDGTGSAPNNTFLGQVRIDTLIPNATGTVTGFTGTHTEIDDPINANDGSVSYISGGVSSKGLFGLAALPENPTTIFAVKPVACAVALEPTNGRVSPFVKSGSIEGSKVSRGVNSSYGWVCGDILALDPADSAVWDEAKVNACELGLEIT